MGKIKKKSFSYKGAVLAFFCLFSTTASSEELKVHRVFLSNAHRTLLEIELNNTSSKPINNIIFTEELPNGVFIFTGIPLSNTCGGMTAVFNKALAGTLVISGAHVKAKSSTDSGHCSIRFRVNFMPVENRI